MMASLEGGSGVSDMLTVGSLFSGIGGIELGLERTGHFETVWQVEKDQYCRRVLAKHWPDVERYEDVRDVGANNLEPVDLICGGFPCQDISQAGKMKGIGGERSGLWSEMWRCVCELRPRYTLVENVQALRFREGGLGVVLRDLAEIGYDAEWHVIPASSVGAPHQRERVFILAYSYSTRCEAPIIRQKPAIRDEEWDSSVSPRGWAEQQYRSGESEEGQTQATVCRVANGIPNRVDRIRALGNAVVPQITEFIGEWIAEEEYDL